MGDDFLFIFNSPQWILLLMICGVTLALHLLTSLLNVAIYTESVCTNSRGSHDARFRRAGTLLADHPQKTRGSLVLKIIIKTTVI